MITKITSADLYTREPALADYLRTGETSFASIFAESLEIMKLDLKNRGLKIRLLTTPFELSTSKSAEDMIERLRYVCSISGIVEAGEDEEQETAIITIEGTNDDNNETWASVSTITFTANGEQTGILPVLYKYYRYAISGTSTTAEVSTCYLLETSFEQVHINIALALIFESLARTEGDIYSRKAEDYRRMYQEGMDRLKYSYDADDDGVVEAPADMRTKSVRISRGRNYVGY